MSLEQLDAFLARVKDDPDLRERVQNPAEPLELADFLALARSTGFAVEEADVIAAQQRVEAGLSDEELQRRAGEEARRLRHFIPG
jgi:predicted ribosomally synthesized peptide with nif11-like leader